MTGWTQYGAHRCLTPSSESRPCKVSFSTMFNSIAISPLAQSVIKSLPHWFSQRWNRFGVDSDSDEIPSASAALQRKSHLCFPFSGIARPQSQFHIYVSVNDLYIYFHDRSTYFPGSRKGRTIMGIYKSLKDTSMWKLELRLHNSFSGNICYEFSVFCLCSVSLRPDVHVQVRWASFLVIPLVHCVNQGGLHASMGWRNFRRGFSSLVQSFACLSCLWCLPLALEPVSGSLFHSSILIPQLPFHL